SVANGAAVHSLSPRLQLSAVRRLKAEWGSRLAHELRTGKKPVHHLVHFTLRPLADLSLPFIHDVRFDFVRLDLELFIDSAQLVLLLAKILVEFQLLLRIV